MENKTFYVWHRNEPTFMDNDPALAEFPKGFTLVAKVETDNVGNVFGLTNHIDSNWADNVGVTVSEVLPFPRGQRSTSVGDVIEEIRGNKAGVRYAIEGIGLREF